MSSRRREWKFGSVNPGNGSSEKAKLEMVIDGGQVAALRIKRADFVLDFLESAFDFPSGGIIFDHPFGRERKIGRDQRESKVAVVNEDDFDPAFQCFGHADDLGKRDLAFSSRQLGFESRWGCHFTFNQLRKYITFTFIFYSTVFPLFLYQNFGKI